MNIKTIIICALALLPAQGLIAAPEIGGSIEVIGAAGVNDGDFYRGFVRGDFEFRTAIEETEIYAKIRGEEDSIRINNPEKNNPYKSKDGDDFFSSARFYLREAYISQDFFFDKGISGINFKLGKLIYTWGSCDEVKPVDILNPQDLSYLFMKPLQERKYGLYSGMVTISITDSIFLEGVFMPQFQENELSSRVFVPEDIRDLEDLPSGTAHLVNTNYPKKNLSEMNYGARFGFSVYEIDTHVNYFWGYEHMPNYSSELDGLDYYTRARYAKIQMFGLDFQRAVKWGIAVRGEFAYFERGKHFQLDRGAGSSVASMLSSPFGRDLLSGGNGLVEKDQIQYTAGFDVTDMFTDGLYFNLQFNQEIIVDYSEKIAKDEFCHLIIWTLEYSFLREKARVKLRGFYYINDSDIALNPEFRYNIGSNYEIAAGVWVIEGARHGAYGQFRDKDLVYISGKATF